MKYEFPNVLNAIYRHVYLFFSDAFWSCWNTVNLNVSVVRTGRDVCIRGLCRFMARHKGDIVLGDRVVIESRFAANPVGLLGPSSLHALCGGHIEIGSDTGLSSPILSSRSSIRIGERCRIGGNVRIFDHDFHALESFYRSSNEDSLHIRTKPVCIDDDVFIGANAVILKGTHIGARSIVAAGSVVFGLNVPPDSLVKGNPAVIVERGKGRKVEK